MNILKQFLYRSLWWKYLNFLYPISNKFESKDKYDDFLNDEILKKAQINILIWLEKEINNFLIEFIHSKNEIKNKKATLLKIVIFDSYVLSYIDILESDEVKSKLKVILNYVKENYKDSNRLALWSLKKYEKKYLK